jgi:AcrR family transcriptional regulator
MEDNTRQARKEKQAEFVRDQFIDAAWSIIMERGMGALKVDEVARRAGYAPGSVYNYFASKDDLIVRAWQRDSRASLAILQVEIPAGLSLEAGLVFWVKAMLSHTDERRSLFTDMAMAMPVDSPEAQMEMRRFMKEHLLGVVELMAKRLASMLPETAEPPEEAAWLLLGLVKDRTIRWIMSGDKDERVSDHAETIVRMFLHGALGRPLAGPHDGRGKS